MNQKIRAKTASKFEDLFYATIATFTKRWRLIDAWIDRILKDDEIARDDALARNFKSDATIIEEAPVPISAHIVLYVVVTLLVIALLWSVFGKIDRIVVAPGTVATRTPLVVMQPFTTSRILKINVKAGNRVHKGQVLVVFDPTFAQADLQNERNKAHTLILTIARIEAQLRGDKTFSAGDGTDQDRTTQAQIFAQEMSNYTSEIAQRTSKLAALDAQYRAAAESIGGLKKRLTMSHEVEDIYKGLLAENAGAPLDVMRAESSTIDVDLHLKEAVSDVKNYAEQRVETKAELRAFIDKWRSDHNQQLVEARQNLSEAQEALNKAARMEDLTELRAPANGVVLEVADRSVGSVLREAETMVTMVPDNADLYIEASVSTRDISYIRVGDLVRIKLETYPFQRFGTLDGRLENLSPDSIPVGNSDSTKEGGDKEQQHLVYHAQVRVLTSPKDLSSRGFILRPGLVATAEIKTGKRSIASYILNPFLRISDESMREP